MGKLNIRNRNKDKLGADGKPKAPNWEYRFEGAKIDGKRKSISKSGFRTKKDAEIAGAKALAEYNATGISFEPSDISMADYLDFWLDSYVKPSLKYSTQINYSFIIENHLKPDLGAYKLKALSPITIQDYVNRKYATGLMKNTLQGIISVLTASLNYAVIPAELIKISPAEHIRTPKLSQERTESLRTIISNEDFSRMLERFPKGNPFRYALLIGFYAGLRISETFGLTWDDIDFKEGTLTVNKQVYKRNYGVDVRQSIKLKGKKEEKSAWYFGDPKTYSSTRVIKVGASLLSELKEFKKLQLENQMIYGEYYNNLYAKEEKDEKGNTILRIIEVEKTVPVGLPQVNMVMRRENGQYSSTDSFKYASRVIHYELGIKFNYHSLRHTHATRLIELGVQPTTVQARLGHTDIRTTLQNYVHNTPVMESGAVDIFERYANN